jgi:restriction endonuclease S subunit
MLIDKFHVDSASKDVKKSSLLSDTLEEQDYMTETLQKMEDNRDENQKLLKQKKSLIQDLWLSERQALQHTTSC